MEERHTQFTVKVTEDDSEEKVFEHGLSRITSLSALSRRVSALQALNQQTSQRNSIGPSGSPSHLYVMGQNSSTLPAGSRSSHLAVRKPSSTGVISKPSSTGVMGKPTLSSYKRKSLTNNKDQKGKEHSSKSSIGSNRRTSRSENRQKHIRTGSLPRKKKGSRLPTTSKSSVISRLKFAPDDRQPYEDVVDSDSEELSIDETVRLFEIMPKGLQRFLSLGPPKACKDKFDYAHIDEQHKRLLAELKMQQKNNIPRAHCTKDRLEELLQDMISFNDYYVERKQLIQKDRAMFVKNLNERYRISENIQLALSEMEELEQKRDILLKRVEKLDTLKDFERKVLMSTSFKSFDDLMQKHASLKHILKNQVKQMFIGQEHLEELRSLKNDYVSGININHIQMKMKIKKLTAILNQKVSENHETVERILRSRGHTAQANNASNLQVIEMSAMNLTNQLMAYRPFTRKRFKGVTTVPEKIQAIGEIISIYNEICDEGQSTSNGAQTKEEQRARQSIVANLKQHVAHGVVQSNVNSARQSVVSSGRPSIMK